MKKEFVTWKITLPRLQPLLLSNRTQDLAVCWKKICRCLFTDSDLMFDANSGGVTICGFVENLTNLIQLFILCFVKKSMEEEVGGVLALIQRAHPTVAHAHTS